MEAAPPQTLARERLLGDFAAMTVQRDAEAAAWAADAEARRAAAAPGRLRSLDVVRGFTVLLMIFVDNAGHAYACVNHSPWDGLTLADVVMPFFLFMVGVSVPLALAKRRARAGRRVAARTLKLLALGLVLQGGGMPAASRTAYTWGYDLREIRVCGILQRIAGCYGAVGFLELASPRAGAGEGLRSRGDLPFVAAAVVLAAVYLALTYALPVPSYRLVGGGDLVSCGGARGALGVECNAAGRIDRVLWGPRHLYSGGAYARLDRCSSCSPGLCPSPDAPAWCSASQHGIVDPEGTLSSLMACVTTILGALFGRALSRCRPAPADGDYRLVEKFGSRRRVLLRCWSTAAAVLGAAAFSCQGAAGIPWNKQLWSPTYCLGTAGLCGACLASCFALLGDLADDDTDRPLYARSRRATEPLRRVGKNALLLFVLGASDVLNVFLEAVYVSDHGKRVNLVSGSRDFLRAHISGSTPQNEHALADLCFVFIIVLFWLGAAWVLDAKGVYWTA